MIPERCEKTDTYDGVQVPVCFPDKDPDFCMACMAKHHEYIDASRPPMSVDFREFHTYLSMQLRLLQSGRFKSEDFPLDGSLYDLLSSLEKSVRTGSYRHSLVMLKSTLERFKA